MTTSAVELAGRAWTFRFSSTPQFESALGERRSRYALGIGVLLTLLVTYFRAPVDNQTAALLLGTGTHW